MNECPEAIHLSGQILFSVLNLISMTTFNLIISSGIQTSGTDYSFIYGVKASKRIS